MRSLIEVNHLTKRYKSYHRGGSFLEATKSLFVRKPVYVDAVKDISFSVDEGEILGLIGPNGAGKSTTIKMLTGIMYPTTGSVTVMGDVPWSARKHYVKNIGAVFGQKSQLLWDVPPLDSFLLNKAIYNIPKPAFDVQLDEMLSLLSISDLVKKPTRQLSLGERMKCEFVMAMLHGPKIVFLDEPTIGLDVIAKEKIRKFIREMNAKGVTFILTTHDIGDIESLAKKVIVINHGEIVFDDSIDVLKGKTEHRRRMILTVKEPFGTVTINGIEQGEIKTDYEREFFIDTSVMSIAEFIAVVNDQYGILDVTVTQQPIEKVIKALYTM